MAISFMFLSIMKDIELNSRQRELKQNEINIKIRTEAVAFGSL